MEYEEVKSEYLDYLMNRVGLEKDGDDGYLDICRLLLSIDFFPVIEMDENRCYECEGLRKDFEDWSGGQEIGWDAGLGESGTMMELLVVLAEKMRYELSDSQYEASTRKWFRELLGNCGMDIYAKNCDYKRLNGEGNIRAIAEAVIFREIGWDGEGGLFPLYLALRDQRRTELICQMNDYLEENYDIC